MSKNLSAIAAPLVEWYQSNRRTLPWREDKNPYHVWVSEIMLQQTRIEAVIEHYYAFMAALPTLSDLAAVEEEKLLKLWEGLGYYSRARNLKKAAVKIMSDFGGDFPRDFKTLRTLPGIGDYTAGAIASICFGEQVPAVDGNVLRVLARITADETNVLLPETKKKAEALLKTIIPPQAGDFNEGLMELGETICLPNTLPLCERCPLREYCEARKQEKTADLPVRIKETKRKVQKMTVFILRDESGCTAIRKREEKGLLAGLFELPHVDGFLSEAAAQQQAADWGLEALSVSAPEQTKHIFTHIEWQMRCYRLEVKNKNCAFIFAGAQELNDSYALPTAFGKCLN